MATSATVRKGQPFKSGVDDRYAVKRLRKARKSSNSRENSGPRRRSRPRNL